MKIILFPVYVVLLLSVPLGILSVETGFVASPNYLEKSVYAEYFVAISYLFLFCIIFWKDGVWRWSMVMVPVISLLFARVTVGDAVPYLLNLFMSETEITYSYEVISKERTKRCTKAVQLSSRIENRFFDSFNFCDISYFDHERVSYGNTIEIKGIGSQWGFYPAQYRLVD